MTVALAAAVGFVAGRLVWVLLRGALHEPAFLRENYRGHVLPTAGGLVVAVAVVLVEGGRAVAAAAGAGAAEAAPGRAAVVIAVLGMALLGLVDDLAGGDDARGFRGHLRALARGRLTTGALKLFGGALVAVAAAGAAPSRGGVPRVLVDAALVALAANLANLLDRAPGRTTKSALVAFALLALATQADAALVPAAVVLGAAAALLLPDLREHLMLGDTGANVAGAAVGLATVLACAPATRTAVAAALLVLNLLSEVVSFSSVIARVPPLRAFDRLGRPAAP